MQLLLRCGLGCGAVENWRLKDTLACLAVVSAESYFYNEGVAVEEGSLAEMCPAWGVGTHNLSVSRQERLTGVLSRHELRG